MTIRCVSILMKNLRNAAECPARGMSPIAVAAHTPAPSSVTVAGSLQEELGCPGDWQPDCAATHSGLRRRGRCLAGDVQRPGRQLGIQGAAQRRWDENYGQNAQRGRRQHPSELWAPPPTSSSTTPTRPTGSPTTSTPSSRPRRAASRANSAAPATGSRAACAPGCRTPTATGSSPSGPVAARWRLRGQGGHRRELGPRTTARVACRTAPTSRSTCPADCAAMHFSFDHATKILTVGVAPAAATAGECHHRRQSPGGARLPGRLAAGLRGYASRLRRRRHGLAGRLRGPGRQLGVQSAAQRQLGRELRRRTPRRTAPTSRLSLGAPPTSSSTTTTRPTG